MRDESRTKIKGFAVFLGIVCLICGIVAGNMYPAIDASGYSLRTSFNWQFMLSVWFGGFILCTIIYILGSILDKLNKLEAFDLNRMTNGLNALDRKMGLLMDHFATEKSTESVHREPPAIVDIPPQEPAAPVGPDQAKVENQRKPSLEPLNTFEGVCSNCGTKQRLGRSVCYHCESTFDEFA